MEQLIPIVERDEQQMVDARELHAFLEVGTHYKDWVKRMLDYGFEEGSDYTLLKFEHAQNKQEATAYILTLDTAKEICMLQRSEKGKQARRYFIEIEKQAKLMYQQFRSVAERPALDSHSVERMIRQAMVDIDKETSEKRLSARLMNNTERVLSENVVKMARMVKDRVLIGTD
jgi:phage anti-repressor protein